MYRLSRLGFTTTSEVIVTCVAVEGSERCAEGWAAGSGGEEDDWAGGGRLSHVLELVWESALVVVETSVYSRKE